MGTYYKRGEVFNTSVTANQDILSSDIDTAREPSRLWIHCSFSASGVLSLTRTKGATTVTEKFERGQYLEANSAYEFPIMTDTGETYNLQYSVNATALKILVIEEVLR